MDTAFLYDPDFPGPLFDRVLGACDPTASAAVAEFGEGEHLLVDHHDCAVDTNLTASSASVAALLDDRGNLEGEGLCRLDVGAQKQMAVRLFYVAVSVHGPMSGLGRLDDEVGGHRGLPGAPFSAGYGDSDCAVLVLLGHFVRAFSFCDGWETIRRARFVPDVALRLAERQGVESTREVGGVAGTGHAQQGERELQVALIGGFKDATCNVAMLLGARGTFVVIASRRCGDVPTGNTLPPLFPLPLERERARVRA